MAVVKMKKFTAIGFDTAKEGLMARLMGLGIAELCSQESKIADERWAALVSKEKRDSEISALDVVLNNAAAALKTLDGYDKTKKPLFSGKRAVLESGLLISPDDKAAVESDIGAVFSLADRKRGFAAARNRIEISLIGLLPWTGYEIPLEIQETELTRISIGTVPLETDIELMTKTIGKKTELFQLTRLGEDSERQLLSVICHKEPEEDAGGALKQFGFNKMVFKDLAGTVSENIARLTGELEALAESEAETEKELSEMASRKERIELYYDCALIEKERLEAFDRLLVTDRTFYFEGWVPEEESGKLASILEEQGCYFEFGDPCEDDDPPVLLKNNKFFSPVEVVTGLYSLPSYREPDPTPIYALFYICFFGVMFADIGYGAILALAAFALTGTGKLEGNTYKFIRQLGYCGISAFIWGIVFGSFFGNLVTVFSETFMARTVVLAPLWFDPVNNVMTMLVFSCVFGIVHLFAALGVKAWILIKKGKILEAINDAFMWYVFITGLGLLLAGEMGFMAGSNIGLYLTVTGALGILVLPVFYAKGISKALGLWKLYGIVNYLADVLSYARLLALCLAGAIVAQVFNMLAGMNASGIIGAVMFVIVLMVAHTANFFLSGLSCFVHAIRLQYVEFFGKFFEGNGRPFQPFMKNTIYIKIVKEGN